MDLNIVLAILSGVVIGIAAVTIRITAGLSMKEIYFLTEFWHSLRDGTYEFEDDDTK